MLRHSHVRQTEQPLGAICGQFDVQPALGLQTPTRRLVDDPTRDPIKERNTLEVRRRNDLDHFTVCCQNMNVIRTFFCLYQPLKTGH